MQIRRYRAEDWPQVQAFLDAHWRRGHPLTDRRLFDWQYRGFGSSAGVQNVRVLWHDGEPAGILGVIAGEYWVDGIAVPGAALALWVVREDLRDRGAGIYALMEVQREYRVCVCLGVNDAVRPIYERLGYRVLPALHRYLTVLDAGAACRLVKGGCELPNAGCAPAPGDPLPPCPAVDCDWGPIACQYREGVAPQFQLCLARSAAFWSWRYADSAGYRYCVWRNAAGAIIGRVEASICRESSARGGVAVLRLIEIVPARAGAWEGCVDGELAVLVGAALAWGKKKGCALADFQHATRRLEPTLAAAGFMRHGAEGANWTGGVPNLFQPLRYDASPINAYWRVDPTLRVAAAIEADQTYFVKSDGDMDRPNVWPLPDGCP